MNFEFSSILASFFKEIDIASKQIRVFNLQSAIFTKTMATVTSKTDAQRESWNIGSTVEIYSESMNKWVKGQIIKIFNDSQGEWLVIKYAAFSIKEIQRFNTHIRPIQQHQNVGNAKASTKQTEFATDFSMYQSQPSPCTSLQERCDYTTRVIHAIKYYSSFTNVINISDDLKQNLVKFGKEIYTSLLDDFIHITQYHNDHLDAILQIITVEYGVKCNFKDCRSLSRHFGDAELEGKENEDDEFIFYRNLFDSVHCYLLHSFDIGLRVSKKDLQSNDGTHDYDEQFSNVRCIVEEKANDFKSKRFTVNKFNIKVNEPRIPPSNHNKMTYLDGLYDYVNDHGLKEEKLQKLIDFITLNEYDTDALRDDIDMEDAKNSNLAIEFNTKEAVESTPSIIVAKDVPQPKCVCGDDLKLMKAKECYASKYGPHTVYCDLCTSTIEQNGTVYHCSNGYSIKHSAGYDICLSCFAEIQTTPQQTITEKQSVYDLIKQYIQLTLSMYCVFISVPFLLLLCLYLTLLNVNQSLDIL